MAVPILNREELLNVLKLMEVLKEAENRTLAIIDLKDQAKANKLPLREFQQLIKQAELENEPIAEYTPKPFNLPNIIQETIINLGEYMIDEDGIKLLVGKNIIEVCPHPILPIKIMKDIKTGEEKIKIAYFKKTTGWNYDIVVDRLQLATSKGVTQLARYGVMANDENARYMVKFFCDIEMLNIEKLSIQKACGYLGKTEYGWIPYSKDVVYNMQDQDSERRFKLYHECGDFYKWRDLQVEIFDYTIPKICVATAYASLLCETFGLNPFAVHLWGETGKGKSVAMLAAASIYGYPDIKNGIVYTGNSTANGLEPRLAFVRNFTFFIDELSMKTPEQINNMIYLIMQGQGKARMTQGAKAQDTHYWYLCSLSNAEMPITDDYAKGGIFNRIIQIMPDGNVFGDMDLPAICDTFKNNYGFGAEQFINLTETITEEIQQLRKYYYDQLITTTEDKQANAGSVLLTAFEVARKHIYQTDKQLTVDEVKEFLFTHQQIAQVNRIYDKLIEWVEANDNMFNDSILGSNMNKWGSFKMVSDTEYEAVNILNHRLEEFCNKAGINLKQFITGLRQRGLLIHQHNSNTNRARIWGKVSVCYTIKLPVTSELVTN